MVESTDTMRAGDNGVTHRLTVVDWLIALGFLGLLAWVYYGFFFVDPRMGTMVRILLWGIRIGFPLVGVGIVVLYFGLRRGKIAGAAIGLMIGSVIAIGLLIYPVVSWVYYGRSFSRNTDQYHPYLQLAPHDYVEKPGDGLRVFCLGGSTTEYTDKENRGWPTRLEKLLNDAPGKKPVEVYNLGRQWYTTEHTLINYAVNLRQHKPDVILVMHAVNDLLINADFCYYSFGDFQEDYRHFYGPVYRLIDRKTLWGTIGNTLKKMWRFKGREVVETDIFPGLKPFERNLRSLIDLARADSVRVILMTQPYLFKKTMSAEEDAALIMLHVEAVGPEKEWAVSTALRGMEQYNDLVRRLAREENLPLIDLEAVVPKSLEYFYDDVHYRQKTYDLIAEQIAREMLELKITR